MLASLLVVVAPSAGVLAAEGEEELPSWAIGPFTKFHRGCVQNPLLEPIGTDWESRNAYNPTVIVENGIFYMLYRGEGENGVSQIGLAWSGDGIHWERYENNPVIRATEGYELPGGCEDPRVVKLDGTYYLTYTGYHGVVDLCLATSNDLIHWEKHGPLFPELHATKSGSIVQNPHNEPVRINGKYMMYICDWTPFYVAYSDDLIQWEIKKVEGAKLAGEVGIAITDFSIPNDNIVLFYGGALKKKGDWSYAIGQVLFSREDPERIITEMEEPVLKPTEPYEIVGEVGWTLFMEGLTRYEGEWWLYYGGADRVICLATAPAWRQVVKLEFGNLAISPESAVEGENVVISVEVTNAGVLGEPEQVELKVNGEVVDRVTVTIKPGETKTVSFTVSEKKGTYEVEIGGLTGSFDVVEPPEGIPPEGIPIWTIALAVIVIVATIGGVWLWRR